MMKDLKFSQRQNLENVIDFIEYEHWWEFVTRTFDKNSIFRGHANFQKDSISEIHKIKSKTKVEFRSDLIDTINFSVWETKSTFHRNYKDSEFHLFKYKYDSLLRNIGLYKLHLKPYIGEMDINSITFLQLLQLMQHYGVNTPLIDFSYDKDTALFFAFSELNDQGINTNISEDGGNRFITIVELRIDILQKLSLISVINDDYSIKDLNYNNFFLYKPTITINNENISKQDGVFIYLDNEYSLEQFLSYEYIDLDRNDSNLKEILKTKPIVWHMIPYSSMNFGKLPDCPDEEYDVFAYLLLKGKLGCFLFSDLRGIEQDMKSSRIKLDCVTNHDNCKCISNIKESDWYKRLCK